MTNLNKYTAQRTAIVTALNATTAITTVLFNKDDIPKSLPAAIVILDDETAKNGTSKRFVDTDIAWTVFLIINAHNADDPDTALYSLKESFRTNLQSSLGRDIPHVEYYTSRIDGARLVRIAKISLLRPNTGAAS
jgi:hypothetical protein